LPSSINKDFLKASNYLESKQYKKALSLFLALHSSGIKDGDLNIGYIYEKQGKVKKAKKWYKKMARKYQDTGAMINLALLYRDEYRLKEAKKWFKFASDLNDGDASLELAKLYLSGAKIEKAKKYFEITLNSHDLCESSINDAKKYLKRLQN